MCSSDLPSIVQIEDLYNDIPLVMTAAKSVVAPPGSNGSQARMALFSFFGSWAAQQLNQCLAALIQKNPSGQF